MLIYFELINPVVFQNEGEETAAPAPVEDETAPPTTDAPEETPAAAPEEEPPAE